MQGIVWLIDWYPELKDLSLSHKLKFANPYIFATWSWKPLIFRYFFSDRIHSLKYQRSMTPAAAKNEKIIVCCKNSVSNVFVNIWQINLYHCSLNYTVACYRFSSLFISSLAKKLRKCAFTALFKVTLRPPCKHDNARFITVPSKA